nr:L-threonylcarbamoyladenylate synthase [Clostridioides difficile]
MKAGIQKMKTIISNIDINNIDYEEIKIQAKLLREGKTVIFPTETVYGLGANALDENAVKKIYEAKGRPSDNPLIVHIYEKEEVYDLAKDISDKAKLVIEKLWPGPITIILNKKDIIPYKTSGGLDTVAIRMPSNVIARAIIKEAGIPIAAPSANISGRPSPTKAKHVYEEMNGRVDGIVLGGDSNFGLESTVLDLTEEIPMILRPGSITKEVLEELLGEVKLDPSLSKKEDNQKAKAPGMKYKHYSPNADVYIISGKRENVTTKINDMIKSNRDKGLKTGVMCISRNREFYDGEVIDLGNSLEEVASNLFDALIEMDKKGVDVIYSEEFPKTGVGQAIMNRLLKSAGYKVIKA